MRAFATPSLSNLLVIILLLSQATGASGQYRRKKESIDRKALNTIITTEALAGTLSLAALSTFWYSKYSVSEFHFINDNEGWLQQDKASHALAAYNIGRVSHGLMAGTGMPNGPSTVCGAAGGLIYLTGMEILDGFSEGWGASPGDLLANTLGAAVFAAQQLGWKEQRILLKWSYGNSGIARYNPDKLGKNLPERILKDYNAQTYWLSFNIHSFLRQGSRFPRWINVAAGYSADGMTGADFNPSRLNLPGLPPFERKRQYLLSADIDLTRIRTRSKTLNNILNVVGVLKIPFPALEYNPGGRVSVHALYF